MDPEVSAALFRDARLRIMAVARRLDAGQLSTGVPGTPLWTVRELLAHLTGLTADFVRGNLDGAPGEEWTAEQVSARAGRDVPELLAEWAEYGPRLEELVRRADHPSFLVRHPFLDTGVHEADLYCALRLERPPRELTLAITDSAVPRVAEDFDGLGPYTVTTPEREYRLGDGATEVSVRVETYELSRAVFGRRSRARIESWDWTGSPGEFATRLSVYPLPTREDQLP